MYNIINIIILITIIIITALLIICYLLDTYIKVGLSKAEFAAMIAANPAFDKLYPIQIKSFRNSS